MWAGEKQLFSHNMGTQCAWLRRGMKYRRKKGLQGAFMSPSRFTQEGYSKCAWKTEAPEPSGAKQMHEEGYTAHIRCGRKVCWHFNGECEGGLGCIWPPWDLCPAHDADQRGAGRCQGCKAEAESIWNPCRGDCLLLVFLNAFLACRKAGRGYALHLVSLLRFSKDGWRLNAFHHMLTAIPHCATLKPQQGWSVVYRDTLSHWLPSP